MPNAEATPGPLGQLGIGQTAPSIYGSSVPHNIWWVHGVPTPFANVPTSGTASFTVTNYIVGDSNAFNGAFGMSGLAANIGVDFSAGTWTINSFNASTNVPETWSVTAGIQGAFNGGVLTPVAVTGLEGANAFHGTLGGFFHGDTGNQILGLFTSKTTATLTITPPVFMRLAVNV